MAHPTVELFGPDRGTYMVCAYLGESGTRLDHYAGEVRMIRRGLWAAIDRTGAEVARGASAEAAAIALPRSIEALALSAAAHAAGDAAALAPASADLAIVRLPASFFYRICQYRNVALDVHYAVNQC
jgi:hypothetical protein